MATGLRGPSGTCHPPSSPSVLDGDYGAAAASDVAAHAGTQLIQEGGCLYSYSMGGSYWDLSWHRRPVSGTCPPFDPMWSVPANYAFPDCEYVAKEDVIEVSWLIAGVLFAVWGVKFLRGLFR